MKVTNIKTTAPLGPNMARDITLPFSMPENIAEAIAVWGEETTFAQIVDAVTVRFQAKVRGMLRGQGSKRMSDREIEAEMLDWRPMVRRPVDKISAVLKTARGMSPNELAALIDALREHAA